MRLKETEDWLGNPVLQGLPLAILLTFEKLVQTTCLGAPPLPSGGEGWSFVEIFSVATLGHSQIFRQIEACWILWINNVVFFMDLGDHKLETNLGQNADFLAFYLKPKNLTKPWSLAPGSLNSCWECQHAHSPCSTCFFCFRFSFLIQVFWMLGLLKFRFLKVDPRFGLRVGNIIWLRLPSLQECLPTVIP